MNPQIRFGEDLMSRVSYVMLHEGGDVELTTAVRKALDGLLASLANKAGIKRAEILELAIVGNPIMHHLLLGHRPDAARLGAVRAGHGWRRFDDDRASSESGHIRALVSTCCRASPATSVPIRPA